MAVGIYFDGRRLIRPQAATKIDDTGMYARGLGGGNTVAVVGEATGGEPQRVLWFTDPSYAKSILKSGPLLDGINRAYDPSSQVSGAYLVAAIRVNKATQSRLTMKDTSGRPVIVVRSFDYGIWNNQIKIRLETATNASIGAVPAGAKKLTITYGTNVEQGDDIYRNSFYIGLSDPMAISASCFMGIINSSNVNYLTTDILAYVPDTSTVGFSGGWNYPAALPASDISDKIKTTGAPLATVDMSATKFNYIGSPIPFNRIDVLFNGGGYNANVVTLVAEYWNGSAWTAVSNLVDGTLNGGKTFAADGNISFYGTSLNPYTYPSGWVKNKFLTAVGVYSQEQYWIRLSSSGATSATTVDTMKIKRPMRIDLTDYPTIQELVDYIDAQEGYEAGVLTGSPDTELSTALDDMGGTLVTPYYLPSTTKIVDSTTMAEQALTGVASISSRYLKVAAITYFAVGDYVSISDVTGVYEEVRKITAVGTAGTATALTIDAVPSYAYPIGSIVRECRGLTSNLQAVIDWMNGGNTSYIYGAYPATTWAPSTEYALNDVVLPSTDNGFCYICSDAGTSGTTEPVWEVTEGLTNTDGTAVWTCRVLGRGALNNIPDTYMVGGTEYGTTSGVANSGISQTDWTNALDLLKSEDTPLITCVSYDPAVWAALSTHCSYMSSVGRMERIGFCGGFESAGGVYQNGLGRWNTTTYINDSIDYMIAKALELNSDRMVYIGPGFKAYDENGVLVTYNGAYGAALVAGMFGGSDVATAMTHKSIKVNSLEYNLKWADLDRLLEAGVLPLEYDPGHAYRVCQSITTWLRDDKYNRREVSVRRTADYVARQVRERLDRDFVGSKGTKTTLISIKNATISVLAQCYRAELLAGDDQNPPYKNIQCRLDGDTCYVDFECSPVIPINYIPVSIHLTVFTSTVTG